MATINAINSNIPIEISKGGSNATSFTTTDGVLYFDGSKLTTTLVGNAGDILTSNGAAKAPTFQTQGLVLLQQQSAASSANIAFDNTKITTTYSNYLLTYRDCVPSTNAQFLLTFSTDNGSTYLSTGYVAGRVAVAFNSNAWSNANSTASIQLTGSNTTVMAGFIYLFNLKTASPPFGLGLAQYATATHQQTYCSNSTTSGVNNIKITTSAGTITTGIFTLYGLAN